MKKANIITKLSVLTFAAILIVIALTACDLFGCQHNYTENVVNPTCTEGGYTEHTCTKCDDTYRDSEIAATGHNYLDTVVDPTCTSDGYTTHTCSICSDSYDDSVISALGHNYGSVIVDPICSAEGYTEHACENCSDSYKDSFVPVTAHRFNGGDCIYCGFTQPTEAITPDTSWYIDDIAVFTLTTKEQLAGIATLVNEGNTLTNTVIYLDADIDLGYAPWTPIGNADYAFAGAIIGNGHKISNLAVSSTGSYVGLFGNLSGEISGLIIDNATIFVNGSNSYVGIVAGYTTNKITDVTVDGYVDAKNCTAVGGIAGATTALITDCESTTEVVGFECVGGIAGLLTSGPNVFISLTNNGSISGGNYTGGIFGKLNGGNNVIFIEESQNFGDVSGKAYVGGIVGFVEGKVNSLIQSVTNCSKISGEYYVGGIAGRANNVAINSSSNEGSEISASSCTLISDVYYAYLGGYVGYGYSVKDCVNNSDITYISRGSYVGGIAGYLTNGVTECTNNGSISGYDYVGGIAGGVATSSSATVLNLNNTGAISGKKYVGGTVGQWLFANPITFGESTNSGTVTGSSFVGGIMGCFSYSNSAILTAYNLTNTGDVTGSDALIGGLFGYINGKDSSTVSNCTVKANITGLNRVGGLIGKTDAVHLKSSSNEGSTVTATGFVIEGEYTHVYLGGYVGIGYKISDCINTVDINYTSLGHFVGGIVGYVTSDINNCTNNASITSASYDVGGIAGRALNNDTASKTFATNLTNNGEINGKGTVGGIFGSLYQYINHGSCKGYTITTTVSGLKNTANVTGNSSVGGIVGYISLNNSGDYWCDHPYYSKYDHNTYSYSRLSASDIHNSADINGSSSVGEIFGYVWSDGNSALDNYTVTGKITLNNEVLEGTYDVGSNTNLTLTNRVVPVVEEIPEDSTETPEDSTETPEDSTETPEDSTETPAE